MNAGAIRRSVLVCPGDNLKMASKAAHSDADEVVLDLEDAVAPARKAAARKVVIEALLTLDWGSKLRAFRPNSPNSRYCYRDIVEVVGAAGDHLDAVVLPKVCDPGDIYFADRLLTQIELEHGLTRRIQIEALIETAWGMLNIKEIAQASRRLSALIFGGVDYAADVHARAGVAGSARLFHYERSQILVTARATGLNAVDGVTPNFRDLDHLRQDAARAAEMGFDGKWVIHPAQIEPVNHAFTPSAEEIERARHLVDAYRQAVEEGHQGVLAVDGEMVDVASIQVELKKLAIAEKVGLLDPKLREGST